MVSAHTPNARDSAPQVCLTALDALVTDYLASQGPKTPVVACSQLRDKIACGDIAAALDIISTKLPVLLQDQRLVFRLYKQQFVELMRTGQLGPGKLSELSDALSCARSQLAPSALDAYPEAYTEFKHALQLLVYAGNPSVDSEGWPADCTALLSRAARQELSEVVYQTAVQTLGYKEPRLVQLLTHLLHLRRHHSHLVPPPSPSQQRHQPASSPSPQRLTSSSPQPGAGGGGGGGGGSPGPRDGAAGRSGRRRQDDVAGLCESLLRQGCDAPPLPSEAHGAVVASFNESDIQALCRCLSGSRRDAIAALRACDNQLLQAFQFELGRMQINRPLLEDLLAEYCDARGLQDELMQEEAVAAIGCVHLDERGTHQQHQHQQQQQQGAGTGREDERGSGRGRGEGRGAQQGTWRWRNQELATPAHVARVALQRSASQSPPAKLPCCRPDVHSGTPFEPSSHEDHVMDVSEPCQPPQLAQLPAIAKAGGPMALHAAVSQIDPSFWEAQPALLFDLWACEFSRRVTAGDVVGALGLARTHMTPLAGGHPGLQPQLKAVMGLLLPGAPPEPTTGAAGAAKDGSKGGSNASSNSSAAGPTLDALAASVTTLMSNAHAAGGRHTQLVMVLRELLAVHRAWLRAEKCTDPFQSDLGIAELRLAPPGRPGEGAAAGGQAAACASGAVDLTQGNGAAGQQAGARGAAGAGAGTLPDIHRGGYAYGSGAYPMDVSMQGEYASDDDDDDGDDDVEGQAHGGRGPGEGDLARLMEILNLTRSQAMALLVEFGDVESAVNSAFG